MVVVQMAFLTLTIMKSCSGPPLSSNGLVRCSGGFREGPEGTMARSVVSPYFFTSQLQGVNYSMLLLETVPVASRFTHAGIFTPL